jgi:hypothetical protein
MTATRPAPPATSFAPAGPAAARLRISDLARLAVVGLRTRKLRAALSALGIAIGVAAIVAVLGLSASCAAALNAEIAALGTNLLTVQNGQSFSGGNAELPLAAPAMIARLPGVYQVQSTGATNANVYRSPLIPSVNTNALTVDAATLGLPGERVWVTGTGANGNGGMWLYVAGILRPDVLAPDVDSSVLVGFPFAEQYLSFDGHPTTIYVKATDSRVNAVYNLLGNQANPEDPVPHRSHRAGPARRRSRGRHRRHRHRDLRPQQGLGHRHHHRRLDRRPGRRAADRRPRRTAARHPRRAPVSPPGPLEHLAQ